MLIAIEEPVALYREQIDSATESTITEPPKIDQDDAEAAESVVSAFLDDLRSGDLAAAAERWTGYPELGPDALRAEKIRFIAGLDLRHPAVLAPRDGADPPVVNLDMTITLPEDIGGDIAMTLSTATPELPGAHAFALTIGSP